MNFSSISHFNGIFKTIYLGMEQIPSWGIKRTTSFRKSPFEFFDEFL